MWGPYARAEAPASKETTYSASCQGAGEQPRNLYFGLAWLLGCFRDGLPAELLVPLKKKCAITALQRDALVLETAQKDAAIRRIEREEIRATEEVAAQLVFFLESFGILAEEARGRFIGVQADADEEKKALGVFALKSRVEVAIPGSRQIAGAVGIKKLLQHFFPAEFAQGVFFQQLPAIVGNTARKVELDGRQGFSGAVKFGVHDLLGVCGRARKYAGKALPTIVLQNHHGKGEPA